MRDVDSVLSIDSYLEFLKSLPPLVLWLFFCFSNTIENLFPPWPGDTVVVFSGFLSAGANPPLEIQEVALATYLGNLLGALLMYKFGEAFLASIKSGRIPFLARLYQEENWDKSIQFFQRNQVLVVLFSRFSAGIRFFVSIIAGITKMNMIKFVILYSLAIGLWCGALLTGGYMLGQNWEQIIVILSMYNRVVGFTLALLLILFLFQIYVKKRRKLT